MCSASRRPRASMSREELLIGAFPSPCATAPLPLRGGVGGGGTPTGARLTPTPNPSPQGGGELGRRKWGQIVRHLGEARLGAVGQDGVDGQHVVAHDAVADRARAAGVVAGHAADGGAARGGHVDRKPQARQPQLPVEIVEHDAGLHHAGAVDLVHLDQLLEVLAEVHDQRAPDRLAGLRGAAPARQHAARPPRAQSPAPRARRRRVLGITTPSGSIW